jgi:hypothetical protein
METPGMSQQSNCQARLALPTTDKASMATRAIPPLSLPPLPYADSALEPVISAKTLSLFLQFLGRGGPSSSGRLAPHRMIMKIDIP